MTKKEKILNSALLLFAEDGFKVTSTNKIAKKAGVSEGLIFRHFGNKDGLLKAIMEEGENRAKLLFADIVLETDPEETIRKTLLMGRNMTQNESESNFWKLQYKIKWETEEYGAHKTEPLKQALIKAFDSLGYAEPEMEAESILMVTDGLATRYFLDEKYDILPQIEYLLKKYKL